VEDINVPVDYINRTKITVVSDYRHLQTNSIQNEWTTDFAFKNTDKLKHWDAAVWNGVMKDPIYYAFIQDVWPYMAIKHSYLQPYSVLEKSLHFQTLDLTNFLKCSVDLNMGTISGITHIKTIFSFLPTRYFTDNTL